jgi:hypothetical protein
MSLIAPRDLLHHKSLAVATIDTPHDVHKEHGNLPQRCELESPSFRTIVIHGACAFAPGTRCRASLSRTNLNAKLLAILRQRHVFVHVFLEFLALNQDRLQLNLAGSQSWTYHCNCIDRPARCFPPRTTGVQFSEPPMKGPNPVRPAFASPSLLNATARRQGLPPPQFTEPKRTFERPVLPTDSGEEPNFETPSFLLRRTQPLPTLIPDEPNEASRRINRQ